MMNSQAAWGPIWAVQRVVFQQYFKLDGRATRAEYWWFLGAYLIVALTLTPFRSSSLVSWPPVVFRRYLRCGSVAALI